MMDTLGAGIMSLIGRLLSLFGGQNCTRAIEKFMFGTSKCVHAGVFFIGGSTAVSTWPNKTMYCVGG